MRVYGEHAGFWRFPIDLHLGKDGFRKDTASSLEGFKITKTKVVIGIELDGSGHLQTIENHESCIVEANIDINGLKEFHPIGLQGHRFEVEIEDAIWTREDGITKLLGVKPDHFRALRVLEREVGGGLEMNLEEVLSGAGAFGGTISQALDGKIDRLRELRAESITTASRNEGCHVVRHVLWIK